MRSLSSITLFLGWSAVLLGQSAHGDNLKINCAACHSSAGWEVKVETLQFDHDKSTGFVLESQHASVDCRNCHESLVFEEAGSDCISCHTDIHQQTVGMDCARCHTPENWLVDNITELHEQNGFPLLGAHAVINCGQCHSSETVVRFDRLGNECIVCHLEMYDATTEPNHRDAGYSDNCIECHDISGFDWSVININHDFFPLRKGHEISDCTKCHAPGTFSNTPSDCVACHQADFDATTDPDHKASNFPTDCDACHTIDPGWSAANFTQHDSEYFPIFSGKHNGEWNDCIECHTTPGDFKAFSCTDCHEHNDAGKLANKHDEVSDYSFSSDACYSCHPNGDE